MSERERMIALFDQLGIDYTLVDRSDGYVDEETDRYLQFNNIIQVEQGYGVNSGTVCQFCFDDGDYVLQRIVG